ncbi:MAG: hypothetical protein RR356_02275 [Bacteroidales bacterium]
MERISALIFFFLLSLSLSAQLEYVPVDTLDFANYQADTLYFDKENSLLIPFYIKFDSVVTHKTGNINIMHIGGSHVQAGTLSHRIRKNMLSAYPDLIARRGMIFPYSAANKCNNPSDYKVSRSREFSLIRNVYKDIKPLGLTGIAVYTSDSLAELKIKMNDESLSFVTDRIIVLGFSDSGYVVPQIRIDTLLYAPTEIDTLLRRYTYDIPSVIDSFSLIFPCDSAQMFTLTGILLDNQKPGITLHSIGVNGADLPAYLKCEYFVKDLELIKPDLVIFGIGINDALCKVFDTTEFKNNYLRLIDSIKVVNPECAFIFITNNDSYKRISRGKYAVNMNGLLARHVFYQLANITKGAVWDQFSIMGGLKSMDKWRIEKYAKYDRIHFTIKGYNLLGDLFYNAFVKGALACWESKNETPMEKGNPETPSTKAEQEFK